MGLNAMYLRSYSHLRPLCRAFSTSLPGRISSIKSLQDAFRDPNSPFHIPPGETGPASPDEIPPKHQETLQPTPNKSYAIDPSARRAAIDKLAGEGYDPNSLYEQTIVWGDHDAFQHVNNVRYARFFESGRFEWIKSLALAIGGPERVESMCRGKGVSLILKSLTIDYKRPVTFPDTLLIAHKPQLHPKHPSTAFILKAVAYSYAQKAVVAACDSTIVWYNYDALKRCDPGPEAHAVMSKMMGQ